MHNDRYVSAPTPSSGPVPDAGAPRRRRVLGLAAVLTSTAGLGLSYGIGYTITTVQFQAWGAAGWLTGVAGAVPSLAVVALVPFVPRLAARFGAAQTMVAGAALVALTFALMPVLDSPGWWLLLRLLSGAGLALPWLVGETWINTVVGNRVRGRVLAAYTMLLFSGWALGPVLLEVLGTTGPAPFAVGVLAMAVTAVPLVLARRLAPTLATEKRFALRPALALAPMAMAAALVGGVAEFGYISLLPAYAVQAGTSEVTSLRLVSVLLVGGIVLQLLIGWLADRVDRVRLLATLGVLLALLAIGFALALDGGGFARYAAAFALGGVVVGFYGVGLTMLGERVPTAQLAVANAAFLMSYEAGATVGPVLGGAAIDVWRPHGLVVLVVAVGLGFAVLVGRGAVAGRLPRTGRDTAPPAMRGGATVAREDARQGA